MSKSAVLPELPAEALSLHEEGLREAERHKWIESQKCGCDLGHWAVQEWFAVHWPGFCRCKRIEHVQGRQRWAEFEARQFGRLWDLIVEGDLLTDRILDRVHCGMENLDIIVWAYRWGLPIPRVINILSQLDINDARIDPVRFE